ncbi:MAG: inositol monophosphatase family protein [Candidatus Sumerlaeia bacterium]
MDTKEAIKSAMRDAAGVACDILMSHFGKLDSVQHKGEVDIVTVADKESEKAVMDIIRSRFPDHGILAEESGDAASGNPAHEAEYCWVIDPLDGTLNFAHSVPIFSVSIGLFHQGRAHMGLVADPTRNEWFWAERGQGAWLGKGKDDPGQQIHVSSSEKMADSYIITGFPHNRRQILEPLMRTAGDMIQNTHGILRLGSAAIDLCWVAAGRADAFYEPHLQAWDFAAGSLMVEEAGGRCTNFSDQPLSLTDHEVLATNSTIHEEMRQLIAREWLS